MPRLYLMKFLFLLAVIPLFCSSAIAQNTTGKIVYADDPGRIQVINADGTGQTQLTGGGTVLDDDPVYSPDGSKIAFTRSRGFKSEVCAMNADGTNVVTVIASEDFGHSRNPSWSPDGAKLVFTSNLSGEGKLKYGSLTPTAVDLSG